MLVCAGYNVSDDSKLVDCNMQEPKDDEACRFDPMKEAGKCTKASNYGYDEGAPCILLKLNRVSISHPARHSPLTSP